MLGQAGTVVIREAATGSLTKVSRRIGEKKNLPLVVVRLQFRAQAGSWPNSFTPSCPSVMVNGCPQGHPWVVSPSASLSTTQYFVDPYDSPGRQALPPPLLQTLRLGEGRSMCGLNS